MELEEIVRSVHPVSDEAMEQLRRILTPRKVPARRFLVRPGEVSRELFIIKEGIARNFSLYDGTAMDLLVADRDDIHRLINGNPEWALWTARYLIDGLYQIERRFVFLGQGDAYTKYQNLQQYRTFEVLNQIPLQQIASYLNITPQTLSRIRLRRQSGIALL